MVTSNEIEERWLGGEVVDIESRRLVESFNRIEQVFGRAWLDRSIASGVVGPVVTLPLHVLGEQLAVLQRAMRKERLVARLQNGDRAAFSELHALALCTPDDRVEVEIEPEIEVGRGPRVPDFRLRRAGEHWVHVEVTAPTASETAQAAQTAATSIAGATHLREGTTIQVRFRREPDREDLEAVLRDLANIEVGDVIDRATFVMHSLTATPEITPIGGDEDDRPIYGCMKGIVAGAERAMIVVRVPYTDGRAQQVLDAEAKQLPKEGPGLICVLTHHGRYWRRLVERSYSPKIRRRISGAVLFESGIVPGERGIRLPTIGTLVGNPHARTPLPDWLRTHLEALPPNY